MLKDLRAYQAIYISKVYFSNIYSQGMWHRLVKNISVPHISYSFLSVLCFHSSNTFLPSSVSKKAKISGRNSFASVSISCFGISVFFDAIRHHCFYFCYHPPYMLILNPLDWLFFLFLGGCFIVVQSSVWLSLSMMFIMSAATYAESIPR